ncbi:hypothetical protein QR680_016314 [Steinernema hermaphroditum]|uniref:7TM GPCR serpentine receptor class x (Srx) domain-containing protein n=1 Tax=Steinernema hermaphroditum TaxID=289476 RepID=A0AA39HCZ0_9BILA|nr:hypothetical protein QR680_016314 [Steinernema hermaphroditum]
MDQPSTLYGHELLGRNYVIPLDVSVPCSSSSAFSTSTVVDLCSSTQHMTYSAYVTLSQRSDYSPLLGIVDGNLTYALAPMSCAMHILLAVNRFTSVYAPFRYKTIFSRKNFVTFLPAGLAGIAISILLLFYIIPCNTFGYSASYYSYIMLDCPEAGQQRPFHVARFIHVSCGVLFCFGAIVLDIATIRKLYIIKKRKTFSSKADFNIQFRFTMQSVAQNIPMFIEIVLLLLTDDSIESSVYIRIAYFLLGIFEYSTDTHFLLTRFTDFLNSTTIFIFNPEVRKYIAGHFNRVGQSHITASNSDRPQARNVH